MFYKRKTDICIDAIIVATRLATPRYGSQGLDLARTRFLAREKRRDFAAARSRPTAKIFFGAERRAWSGEVSFPCRVAMVWRGAWFIKNKLSREGSETRRGRREDGRDGVYRVPSRVHGRVQETPGTRRRGGWTRREEEARRRRRRRRRSSGYASESRGNGGSYGPTTKKQLTATYGRCSKDGKVEEHPLEPVRSLGACSESRPDEARRRIFTTLVLARPPSASYFERARNTQPFDQNSVKRSICVSNFTRKFDLQHTVI